jgi:hypothetical protein
MENIIAPITLVAALAGGVMYASGTCSGKTSKKPTKSPSSAKKVEVPEESFDDLFPTKQKKQAPIIKSLPEPVKKVKKEKVIVEKDETNVTPVVGVPAATAAASKKKQDEQQKKKEVVAAAPAKPLSELELLKQRIAELEGKGKAPAVTAATTTKDSTPQQPLSNKQAKKLAKEQAASQSSLSSSTTKKDDKKTSDFNPVPQLTADQKKEQEQALALFEREQNQWREIPSDNHKRDKKKKDKVEYVDLSVLTVTSTMNAHFRDRFIVGKNIDEICKLSGSRIELQQRPSKEVMDNSPNKGADLTMKIDFEGTEKQIEDARQIITELITKGYSNRLTPDMTEAKLRVDSADHFRIVGKGGVTIQKIQEVTGVKIIVPKQPDGGDIIQIVGSADGVATAKDAIKSLVRDGYSETTHPGYTKHSIDYPSNLRHYMFSSYGGNNNKNNNNNNNNTTTPPPTLIRTIENNNGVKLNFPDVQTDNTLTIIGPAPGVNTAIIDVSAVLKKLQQPVNDVYLSGFESNDFKANELW